MDFGIDKCAMLILKRGTLLKSEGIQLPNESMIKSVNEDKGYKYLGILQANQIMHNEMKCKISKENKHDKIIEEQGIGIRNNTQCA